MITQIVATDSMGGIGKNGNLAWHISEDLKHFKDTTLGGVVIMGRKTYESIGRALPNRFNIVLSSSKELSFPSGVLLCHDIETALNEALKVSNNVFIIGGQTIYDQTIKYCDMVILSKVQGDYECDTFYDLDYLDENFKDNFALMRIRDWGNIHYLSRNK